MGANRSLFRELRQAAEGLSALPCPGCGLDDRNLLLRRDRYLLPVEVSVCRRCGLMHLAKGLSGIRAEEFYRNTYPRLMSFSGTIQHQSAMRLEAGYRMNSIREVIGEFDRVLDVGAGFGFFLDSCRSSRLSDYFGLEPGDLQRTFAEQSLGLAGHVAAAGLGREMQLPFQPRLVTMFHVLEHLEEPAKAIRLLSKIVAPEGHLVVEVPDLLADWRTLGVSQFHIGHRSYFTAMTISNLLAANGFAPTYISREPGGIYPGNLRVFARPSSDRAETFPIDIRPVTEQVTRLVNKTSVMCGYPRVVIRLLRLAIRESWN